MRRFSISPLFILICISAGISAQSQEPLPDIQRFLTDAREKLTGGFWGYINPVNETQYVWEEEFIWREVNTKGEVRKLKLHQVVEVTVDADGQGHRRITRVNGENYKGIPPHSSWKAFNQNSPHACHSWKGPREHPEFLSSTEDREFLWGVTEFRLIGREQLNGRDSLAFEFTTDTFQKDGSQVARRNQIGLGLIEGRAWFDEADKVLVKVEWEKIKAWDPDDNGGRVTWQMKKFGEKSWLPVYLESSRSPFRPFFFFTPARIRQSICRYINLRPVSELKGNEEVPSEENAPQGRYRDRLGPDQ